MTTVGAGTFFGEAALLGDGSDQPQVTAVAVTRSKLLRITHAAFLRHLGVIQDVKREQVHCAIVLGRVQVGMGRDGVDHEEGAQEGCKGS